jgi:hypothetical protein
MAATPGRRTEARLRGVARALAMLLMILLGPYAIAVLFPGIIGTDAKYLLRLVLVLLAMVCFGLQGVLAQRDRTGSRAWILLGVFMLLQFVDLILRPR